MAFTVPTRDEMHGFLVALVKALLPEADVSRESFQFKWLGTLAGGVTDNHSHIDATQTELMPDTSEGEILEQWGALKGVTKKPATPARKANALRINGSVASAVPIDQELTHTSGLRFKINESNTIPAAGFVDVDVVAIDTGSATRLNKGEILTFVSTPPGLEEAAALVLDLDEDGEDEEQDPAYRLRVLSRFSKPPLGGAQNDYEQWALEVTGIASAYVYPLRQGLGSVDLAALHAGSGSARVLSGGEVTELQAYVDGKRPVAVKSFRVLTVTTTTTDVEILVLTTGASQYAFDWSDTTPLIVSTWTAGSRTLQFTTARPADMKAGDRIVIKPAAGGGTGEQFVIESLSSTDSVVLETAPALAPVATDTVYSGGPLTDLIRDEILALIDGLGTANPDLKRYGEWEGNLRPEAVSAAAASVKGVKGITVVTPAAVVEASDPGFPNDGTVGLLVPGRVLVREKH